LQFLAWLYSGTLYYRHPRAPKMVLIREVSSFQGANNAYLYGVGTWSSVLIREVFSFPGFPLRGVPLYEILLTIVALVCYITIGKYAPHGSTAIVGFATRAGKSKRLS